MDNSRPLIKINLSSVKQIKYIIALTKESGLTMAKDFINLQHGKIYYVPINDKTAKLEDYTFFKINPILIDYIDVRNICNGVATIIPLVHNYQLLNDIELGTLI